MTTSPPSTPPPASGRTAPTRARIRYHLGLAGGVYVCVTLLIALGAFNSQNNLLFWAFGFALALIIISGILSGAMIRGVEVVREPVAPIAQGDTGAVRYRVRNRNRFVPVYALTIIEVPLPPRSPRDAPPDNDWSDALTPAHAFVPHVSGGKATSASAPIRALRRGPTRLNAFLVSTSFPFGLIKKSLLFEQPHEVLVRPRITPLPHGFVNSAQRIGERGLTPSRRAGSGDEFFSLREYQPGDALRAVAWRASARRGDLLVKQTAAPAPMRFHVLLSFANSPDAAADEACISIAAGVADAAIARGLAVGLRVANAHTDIRPRDGRLQRELLLDSLARFDTASARSPTPPPQSAQDAAARSLRSPGVLIVVHAGPADRSIAPPWALHLSTSHDTPAPRPAEPPRRTPASPALTART